MHTGRFDSPARDNLNVRARDTFRAALIASTCALSACSSMKITSPPNQSTVGSGSVPVLIEFSDRGYSNCSAKLDGVDQTMNFALAYERATAALTTTPGSHTLTASADVYDSFYQRNIAYNVSSTFSVPMPPGPTFTLTTSPSAVGLRRNGVSANVSA